MTAEIETPWDDEIERLQGHLKNCSPHCSWQGFLQEANFKRQAWLAGYAAGDAAHNTGKTPRETQA